jgi:hypothetical protein
MVGLLLAACSASGSLEMGLLMLYVIEEKVSG